VFGPTQLEPVHGCCGTPNDAEVGLFQFSYEFEIFSCFNGRTWRGRGAVARLSMTGKRLPNLCREGVLMVEYAAALDTKLFFALRIPKTPCSARLLGKLFPFGRAGVGVKLQVVIFVAA
jgi:hypothetical protein